MNKYLKEAIWFFVPMIIPVLIMLLFYISAIIEGKTVINIKDTYFVVSTPYFIIIIAVPLGFFVSLFRALYYKFKNKASNYIFGFYSLLFITLLLGVITLLKDID